MDMSKEQWARVTAQFATLKENSAFYAKKFADFDLSDIRTMDDFRKLPFTDKADLREAYPLGIAAVPPEKIVTSRESTQKAERKNKSCLRRKKTKLCFVAAM